MKDYPLTVISAASLLLLLSLSALFFSRAPTGMAPSPPTVDISVSEKLDGRITSFVYKNTLDIVDRQVIVSEFANFGSIPFDAQITVTIYYYNRTLQEEARFEDSTITMNPGARRGFRNEFVPTKTGDYYIKLRVAYQYKVAILWGYFSVYMVSSDENYRVIYNYTTLPPEQLGPNTVQVPTRPNMTLEHDSSVTVEKGSKKIVPVKLKNTGNAVLTNAKLYLSSPNLLYADVSPKEVGTIAPDDYFLFLITIEPLPEIELGDYNLSFDALSGEAMSNSSMKVSVVEMPAYHDWQAMKDLLMSYNYIASELESKMNYLAAYGIDTRAPNATLADARRSMNSAKIYYDVRDYDVCKSYVDAAGVLLEDAALQIGQLTLKIYAAKPALPYIMLAMLITGIVLTIYLVYRHEKRKVEKPKFLRKAE